MDEIFITGFPEPIPCDGGEFPQDPPGDLGDNLRRLRWERGLSVREVAAACGIPRVVLNRYELGEKKLFRPAHIWRLCRFYGVSADKILGFEKGGKPWVVNG